jgi:hypothetical protein
VRTDELREKGDENAAVEVGSSDGFDLLYIKVGSRDRLAGVATAAAEQQGARAATGFNLRCGPI